MLCHNPDMRLRDWRIERQKTLSDVASELRIPHARSYQRVEIGMIMPDAPLIAAIEKLTGEQVTPADIVSQRLEWIASKRPALVQEAAE